MRQVTTADWVAALRSGKYKQGVGGLRRDDRFCCLGVLCEIAEVPSFETVGAVTYYTYAFNEHIHGISYIPDRFVPSIISDLDLLKTIRKDDGNLNELMGQLMTMNDSGNYSFNEIADFIEECK